MADADLLLAWRNDPLTRRMSAEQGEVPLDDHLAWLSKRLAGRDPLLIAETAERVRVGTVRLDGDELSWTVAREHRGQGVGSQMVRLAVERFGPGLRARIRPENEPSRRIAQRHDITPELVI